MGKIHKMGEILILMLVIVVTSEIKQRQLVLVYMHAHSHTHTHMHAHIFFFFHYVLSVFPHHWLLGLLLSKNGHGIFNMHNHLQNDRGAHKGVTGTEDSAQVLTEKN